MIYIKTQNKIEAITPNPIWLNDKPNDSNEYDWNCQRYILTLAPAMRELSEASTLEAFEAQELEEAKQAKIAQLKKNRDLSLEQPLTSVKAFEMDAEQSAVLENEVYFSFSTKSTGNGLTEPSSIVFRALMGSNITYSCEIIEGDNRRKGYVKIDQSVASTISSHLQIRATNTIHETNRIESEIEPCETLEELENININF